MASHTFPGIGLVGGRSAGEDGWAAEMNQNLLLTSALGQLSAKSRVTALPGSPTNGDIYIVPSGASTNPNQVAIRDSGAWTYFVPFAGLRAWVADEGVFYVWDGAAWIIVPGRVEVAGSFAGTVSSEAVVLRYVFTRTVSFKDEFAGSQARAGAAATGSTAFTILRGGSAIGTLTFSAAGTTGVFVSTGTGVVTFAAGDVLTVRGPSGADATLADLAITFLGLG
ncbi:DUF2793 domain-containing protein [Novosphingobium resinovorum]|uniref:DUF2793 domain-containing protein n=1 Tax=Novosphingobium resinovorum TaxID=158500 RepID=A0A1D8A339_9SPHN|nr:DUF2793 domain-containing protein [Novosphingobium resinovorum]AOR76561.1 hypothetical protein BES08_07225 [Novosphingobium resinovorum]